MHEILQVLRRDHQHLTSLLEVLEEQLHLLEVRGQLDYDLLEGILDYCVSYVDRCHHPREEAICERLQSRMGVRLEAVIDHPGLAKRQLRVATLVHQARMDVVVPRQLILRLGRELVDAYREHMSVEEQHLYPAAERHLTEEDWADIDRRVVAQQDPLLEQMVIDRFIGLRQCLADTDRARLAD